MDRLGERGGLAVARRRFDRDDQPGRVLQIELDERTEERRPAERGDVAQDSHVDERGLAGSFGEARRLARRLLARAGSQRPRSCASCA